MNRFDDEPRSLRRNDFRVLREIPTRWADDDAYGHLNNTVHYEMFDTAVNGWLSERVGDVRSQPAIGVVAETGCRYLGELRFPEVVTVGVAVERLGERSIVYRLALFPEHADEPAAVGRFVHVYVDPGTRRPVAVPDAIRHAVALLAG